MDKLKVAIIGCGDIARPYAETICAYDELKLKGFWNRTPDKAKALAREFDAQDYPSLETLLDDPEIEVVVNLTTQAVHAEMVQRCLLAGKHVHSEKPLALSWQEAARLANLAQEKKLRLSVCPITFMGEAQQTLLNALNQQLAGVVRLIYAEVNWHRLESWHPNPEPFYAIGAHYDVAVYPISIICAFLGPARRVQAFGKMLLPERTLPDGRRFKITTPDFCLAVIELSNGAIVRLTSNFYVSWDTQQRGIEFHGDEGSLFLSSWERFDSPIEFAPFGSAYQPLPFLRPPFVGIDWGRSLIELLDALRQDRPHRPAADLAVHTLEILNAIDQSMQSGEPVDLVTTFEPIPAMEWAE